MSTLDKKAAFFHVIDSHRWLAASGCAWNLVSRNAAQTKEKAEVHGLLPNIDVMVRDCLLLHARSLIKFYRSGKKSTTDIVLCDFSTTKIPAPVDAYLAGYERPIEVHLLHLTDHRDPDYRQQNPAKPGQGTTSRPNWDREAAGIAERLIFECLEYVSEQSGKWQTPFKALFDATAARYRDKSFTWPKDLCEKPDVEQYLKNLGL